MKRRIISLGLVSLLLGAIFVGMIGFTTNVQGAGGDWIESIIANPSVTVNSIAVGDVDNDGKSEVVIGMDDTSNELRAYEKVDGDWIEEVTREGA